MKNLGLSLLLFLSLTPASLVAQGKYAHINKHELIQSMPGYEAARDSLQTYIIQHKAIYDSLITEYDTYGTADFANEALKPEIQQLQKYIMYWENNVERLVLEKEHELFGPIITAMENAISKVAGEHNFTEVRDSSLGVTMLLPNSEDIMSFVKQELGIAK